jgi:hypothetical protein
VITDLSEFAAAAYSVYWQTRGIPISGIASASLRLSAASLRQRFQQELNSHGSIISAESREELGMLIDELAALSRRAAHRSS